MKNKKMCVIAVIVSTIFFFGCSRHKVSEHQLRLGRTSFNNLPGWGKDDHGQALEALQKSCVVITGRNPNEPFSKKILFGGKVEDWQKICLAIDDLDKNDQASARKFFEFWFEPYHVYDNHNPRGLFTGYYLPVLKCSLKRSKRYKVPVYAIPEDWVKVDLGLFDASLYGRTFIGQVKNRTLRRYPARKNIVKGDIDKRSKILAWCNDKIDVAFAQIQGSAIVELPNKKRFLIGYDGSNGRSYTSLSKVLIKEGELTPQSSSMQSIRAWLLKHPEKTEALLNQNASYVFFRVLGNSDPLGSQQVPLTPTRSLAVDKRYLPLGIPIWLDTVIPDAVTQEPNSFVPFHHLLIAQDTGGAIRGVVRGDVYWGGGEKAAFIAGHMKSQGEYWVLLPRPHAVAEIKEQHMNNT